MALDDQDLQKIKAVVDTRADLQDAKFERRFDKLEGTMATKLDLVRLEATMATKHQVEEIKTMLTEDLNAFGGDVAKLKRRTRVKSRR